MVLVVSLITLFYSGMGILGVNQKRGLGRPCIQQRLGRIERDRPQDRPTQRIGIRARLVSMQLHHAQARSLHRHRDPVHRLVYEHADRRD